SLPQSSLDAEVLPRMGRIPTRLRSSSALRAFAALIRRKSSSATREKEARCAWSGKPQEHWASDPDQASRACDQRGADALGWSIATKRTSVASSPPSASECLAV